MTASTRPDVAIIGAGPYGLSLAAHLASTGVGFRIFGPPMQTWRSHMPKGMFLKSEGCASSLFDPAGEHTLERFCAAEGLRYGDSGVPVSLETFTRYALSFQQRFVPNLEEVMVSALEGSRGRFELRLASGEALEASQVVIATGVSHAAYVPEQLSGLPAELTSHCGTHHDLTPFRGRHVTIIGAGQSGLETAALLHEAGAEVLLVSRKPALAWNAPVVPGERRSLYERLRRPMSELGPGVGPWLYCNAPLLFRLLPRDVRLARVKKVLGPAGAGWLRDRFEGKMPVMLGCSLEGAAAQNGRAVLRLRGSAGEPREVVTDHVLAATGYRFTVAAQPFLSERLRGQLRTILGAPILNADFESSVPGLYFTGLASAYTMGPAMRFIAGAGFTARQLARHLSGGGRSWWPIGGHRVAGEGCR